MSLEQLETRAVPAAIAVTTTADDPNVPIDGQVTLRDAINQMNKSDDPTNTISFAANVTGNLQLQAALPALAKNITIDGPGMAALDVLGSGPNAPTLYNVFTVMPNTTCKIDNISIAEGDGDFGGGIYNMGDLTLLDVSISDCSVTSGGGGIFNARSAELTMTSTLILSNFAVHNGGGIENEGQLQVFQSQIQGNSASQGGGLFNAGSSVTIKANSLINTNYASTGGGVYMSTGTVSMTGGSISNNSAVGGNGGGLYVNAGKLTLTAGVTIGNNGEASNGGGMYINGGTVSISAGSIYNNDASNAGGGIYNLAGSLTLKGNVTVGSNNQANNGGGLYLGSNSTTTFNGCTISGNEANNLGVGYYQQNGATINPLAINNQDGFDRGP